MSAKPVDPRCLVWLSIPDWAIREARRWSPQIVTKIAEDYVINLGKDSKYSYKDACKHSGYNYINGFFQKSKDPVTKKSNPVYRRLQSAVKRVQKRRREHQAENTLQRMQEQEMRGHEGQLARGMTRVLGTAGNQSMDKSFSTLLTNYKNMKKQRDQLVQR